MAFRFVQKKGHAFLRSDKYEIAKNKLTIFKNLSSHNHSASIN